MLAPYLALQDEQVQITHFLWKVSPRPRVPPLPHPPTPNCDSRWTSHPHPGLERSNQR